MAVHRLLLVDDEVSLLRLMEKYLRRVGYEVDACSSGQAGWEAFEAGPDRYSAVIVDLNLPDVRGEELLRRMRGRRPGIPAVVCSGTPASGEDSGVSPAYFLLKPFLPSMLATALKTVIR